MIQVSRRSLGEDDSPELPESWQIVFAPLPNFRRWPHSPHWSRPHVGFLRRALEQFSNLGGIARPESAANDQLGSQLQRPGDTALTRHSFLARSGLPPGHSSPRLDPLRRKGSEGNHPRGAGSRIAESAPPAFPVEVDLAARCSGSSSPPQPSPARHLPPPSLPNSGNRPTHLPDPEHRSTSRAILRACPSQIAS